MYEKIIDKNLSRIIKIKMCTNNLNSLEEIEDIIKNYYEMSEEYLKKINDRKIGYAIIWENGKVKLFYSKDAIYFFKIFRNHR